MLAKDIMSKNVLTVGRDTTIEEIAHILADNNISGVPVIDGESRIIGMVTQKDLLYKDVEPRFPAMVEILGSMIFLGGAKQYNEELRKLVATKAEDIMSKNIITVNEDFKVEGVAQLMVERDINRVPVVNDGRLVGIISRADIVKYIAKSME